MTAYVLPVVFTILMWWASTGVVLCAVRRPPAAQGSSLAVATLLALLGAAGLWVSATDTSLSGVYIGFASALAVWGWHELTFLLGLVTGPNRMPAKVAGRERAPLMDAIAAVIYHEAAIALAGAAVIALTWGGENATGVMTYLILWVLRLSAKINIYLGVPNHAEEFLPAHLKYLATYFCHRPMNFFFPLSVTAATLATAALVSLAADTSATTAQAASATILATLLGLAVVEHWFLVMPFKSVQLWTWGLTQQERPLTAPAAGATR